MNYINDEMLNNYLDNDLTSEEMQLVKSAIANSVELKKRYEALLSANNLLRETEIDFTSAEFTKNLMQKIKTKSSTARQQKYFLLSFLVLFGLIIFSITGYVLYEIILSVQANESTKGITAVSKNISEYFSGLFSKNNLSIFGSVLSFIMIISGYFLYEYQKQTRKKFGH
ncbi:MAG TPA: hypothetical protein DHV28_02645 [Ignavibacteriales bacterium]|nr:hypothetical protein [Ignavibacteriales bacterium]